MWPYSSWGLISDYAFFQRCEYDALGRRVKANVDTDSPGSPDGIDTYRHFYYSAAWQVLETRKSATESTDPESLQPEFQYVWCARYIDAPVLRDQNTDQDGLCDDERLFYTTDANMNVTALVNTSGTVVERYTYSPYGEVSIYDASWSSRSSSSYASTILFAGYPRDAETGLYHVRNRMYHSTLGRWMQRDPKGYGDGMGLYEYVRGWPLSKVDPHGTELHIVEAAPEESKDKPQYTPKTEKAKKPDGKVEEVPIVKAYVDASKGMADTVKQISDDEFNALKKAGRVVCDGKPFEGSRQDFIEKLNREANSTWEVQNSGGLKALKEKADDLKTRNTQPEDSTGIAVHGAPGAKDVRINSEKVPREKTMNELGERKGAKGDVVTGSCYREKGIKEGFRFEGGGKVDVSEGEVKSITFTPAKVRVVREEAP